MMKLSALSGLDIYDQGAKQIGKAHDVIIDLQRGEVVRFTLEPLRAMTKEEAKRIFTSKTVLFRNVKSIGSIIIISNAPAPREEEPEPEAPKQHPYSYRYREMYGKK
ncbi:PRC-barrel domain-containing protein [Candidatus Micrarchaeota archaeon]|nr:PRC-barrel domain-containing protein [Candidatus Micrarchaeota archaeon]MBI5177568.1 PRC-barrel domain-containing protein [Candidatus Micrarchaeota archaeon]